MAKAGRRKPRKQISSAMRGEEVPKAVTSQTSDGVRKKSSMGMFFRMVAEGGEGLDGEGHDEADGDEAEALRRAVARSAWMPSAKGRCQRSGKKK